MEIIAGLRKHDSGLIYLKGKEIGKVATGKRNIGLMFQGNSLFPHKTVRSNIAFPVKQLPAEKRQKTVVSLAKTCGIEHRLDHYPAQLSGGEIQRTILARTLAMNPGVLLLDEPLRSLDATIKSRMESLLRKLNREGQTIIHVTHDYREAMALAKHVAVIQQGEIIQQGSAEDVFHHPANEFIARFTGTVNYFEITNPEHDSKIRFDKEIAIPIPEKYRFKNRLKIIIPPDAVFVSKTNHSKFKIIDMFKCPAKERLVVQINELSLIVDYEGIDVRLKVGESVNVRIIGKEIKYV